MTQLAKWLAWYSPMFAGRFDFYAPHTTPNAQGLSSWIGGQAMLLGRHWVRVNGGHNLRRRSGHTIPTMTDPLCGASAGRTATIRDIAAMHGHAASTRWTYRLTAVGAGGVEDDSTVALREVVVTAAAALANPIPNPVLAQFVRANGNGSFTISWLYRPRHESIAPADFVAYTDSGTGTVDYSTAALTVNYVAGQTHYEATTAAPYVAGSSLVPWRFVVRARVTSTRQERFSAEARALGTDTPPYGTVESEGAPDPPITPLPPRVTT